MSNPPPEGEKPFLKAYDQYGRELQVDREEWRSKVLPRLIEKEWDDAAALYETVAMALGQGFVEESLEAAERLMVIDSDSERSHSLLAHVRMELGNLDEARRLLEDYLKAHAPSASVLTRYARLLSRTGEQKKALAALWDALRADPNEKESLEWWGAIHRARGGEKEFLKAMEDMALKGSWRARLHLARHALMARRFDRARAHFQEALKAGGARRDLLGEVSGDLSAGGRHKEVLELVAPLYDPQKHGSEAGFNLLEAYLRTRGARKGRELLKKMFLLGRPDLEEKLLEYSDRLEGGSGRGRSPSKRGSKSAVRLDRPVWFSALKKPLWLLPEQTGPRVLILPPRLKRGGDDGLAASLCRGLPLYFLEYVLFRSKSRLAAAMLPPAEGGLDAASVRRLAKKGPSGCDFIVSGDLDASQGQWALRLEVWDARKGVKTGIRVSPGGETLGRECAGAAQWLLEHFAGVPGFGLQKGPTPFGPVPPELMERHLEALNQLHELSLIGGRSPKRLPKGERRIFNGLLDLCARMKGAQAPKLIFLAALARAKDCGSQVHDEFKTKALTLLEEETDEQSPFYRLSPLLYGLFSMPEERERRIRALTRTGGEEYRRWLEALPRPR